MMSYGEQVVLLICPSSSSLYWLFAVSPKGARAIVGLYILIETAKANGLAPCKYLRYLFEQLPFAETNDDYGKLLPSNFGEADLALSQVATEVLLFRGLIVLKPISESLTSDVVGHVLSLWSSLSIAKTMKSKNYSPSISKRTALSEERPDEVAERHYSSPVHIQHRQQPSRNHFPLE